MTIRTGAKAAAVVVLYVIGTMGLMDLWSHLGHLGDAEALSRPPWLDFIVVGLLFPAAFGFVTGRMLEPGRAVVPYAIALALGPLATTTTRVVLDDPSSQWVKANAGQLLVACGVSGASAAVAYFAASKWRRGRQPSES